MSASEQRDGGLVKSVDRCLRVLRTFTPERPELRVGELARLHGVHVSSMSRLLATMSAQGFLRRGLSEGSYRLGFALVELGTFARAGVDVRGAAAPIIWELARRMSTTVSLAIRSDSDAIVIERAPGVTEAFGHAIWVGSRLPLHASGHGKALIAFLPPDEQDALIAAIATPQGTLKKYTPATIDTTAALKADFEKARVRGYVVSNGEFERTGGGVAAPVFDHDGVVRASVAIPELTPLFDAEREQLLAHLVLEAADQISELLGGQVLRAVNGSP